MIPARTKILLPLPFDHAFDYRVADPAPPPGSLIRVPFGKQERIGVVWDGAGAAMAGPAAAVDKLRDVGALSDLPPLTEELRRLVDRVAAYTLSPPGSVLRLVLSCPAAFDPPAGKPHVMRTGPAPQRLTPARRKLLDLLADGLPRPPGQAAAACGVGVGVVRGLVAAGTLSMVDIVEQDRTPRPDPTAPGPALSDEQRAAADRVGEQVEAGEFATFLMEGVTGSGKTEVYFDAIARALARPGAQCLVLLPEIALTSQWVERFTHRFGVEPARWHSGLSPGARRKTWRAIAQGEAAVVVGARSALFLPFRQLSLIVVDEEHDPSFKQEDGVLYNARDMAVLRASLAACPIVLASATPSLESRANAQEGRYRLLSLTQRHGGARLPGVRAVDLRDEPPPPGQWLSPPLAAALDAALERGEQSLLFLNRRGYAPLTLCRACGTRLDCPRCAAWLVEHRYRGQLQCHHCGFAIPPPERCPACGAEDSLVACGPGIERLAEEVLAAWPQASMALMASDMMLDADQTAALVRQIAAGDIDIVIGTQLITKGYHFPRLTLVGVIDADLGLRGGDLRAAERTYQQLVQVAGRAGREQRPGQVLLQTHQPDNPVIKALVGGDVGALMTALERDRKDAALPPFGRLAGLVISGPDLADVTATGADLARRAPRVDGVDVFGPAPAPLARLRGFHRHRLLLKTRRDISLQRVIKTWLDGFSPPRSVRLKVDIDPMSFI